MSRPPIEKDFFCHVYNRGTDKRVIFDDTSDYQRFVLYLNVLNNKTVENPSRLDSYDHWEHIYEEKERLVSIIAFCLMPNHFHLLLHERTEGGISKFMQRLGIAYSLYFNEKNKRTGVLFQGKYKYKIVDDEAYLFHLINYIHLNPKDLMQTSGTLRQTLEFLPNYKWSSYNDFCKRENYSHLLQTEAANEFITIPTDYARELLALYDSNEVSDAIPRLLLD